MRAHDEHPDRADPRARRTTPRSSETPAAAELLALQRAAGNAAVTAALGQEQHAHSDSCGHSAAVQRSALHDVLGSSGRSLAEPVRTNMEDRMGVAQGAFQRVRIHDSPSDIKAANSEGALALTSGSHVVGDVSNPVTLVHELTHVIQQSQGPVAGTDNGRGLSVSDPSDRFEREAEANATRVMRSSTSLPQQNAAPTEMGGGPVEGAIQRRVSLKDAQDPQKTRDLSNEPSVRAFFKQYDISVFESVKTLMRAPLGVAAAVAVEIKAKSVIQDFTADEKTRVYEDSKAGAQELADAIGKQVVSSLAAPHARSARPLPSEMVRQMSQRQPSSSNLEPSLGGPGHGAADLLSQLARQKMVEHTPENPLLTGLGEGVKSAVTGRAAGLTGSMPSSESMWEGMRWAAWVALEGEDKVLQAVNQSAQHVSPEEGRRLREQFDDTLAAKKQEFEGSILGSVAAGGAIGKAVDFLPIIPPPAKVAVKAVSTGAGLLGTAKKIGDGADAVKKIEEVSPQAYGKLRKTRDEALDQAIKELSERSRESTMEQMRDFGNFG
ncbi:DUF4157 domain-containing protein [Kitasatospora sp. GAS1066B]|uniref:eCIS core domain-containing protein n=1 Tax=Kitasatospora sp. GAS1066B TaxID=3156271 RepID=UPI003517B36E